jgi:hypothetical protein
MKLTFQDLEPLVKYWARRYTNYRQEYWDLYQQGLVIILELLASDKNFNKTYASIFLRGKLLTWCYNNYIVKISSRKHARRCDMPQIEDLGQFDTVDQRDLLEHIEVTQMELKILKLKLEGLHHDQIAKKLGLNHKARISEILQQIKIRNHL